MMYGLIGKKLEHSFSSDFFNNKFEKEKIPDSYRLFPIDSIAQLPELIASYPNLNGLNVTIPYKEEVIPFLDEINSEAKNIGAVNVIKIKRDESGIKLKGYNTDCIGFRKSLLPLLREDIKNALVLGTGGASKSIVYVLESLGIKATLVSRNPEPSQLGYKDLDRETIYHNKLIVNTTPLGMFPDIKQFPEIPYSFLTDRHICFDLIYNPTETEFMKLSQLNGARVKNGLEMLYIQAIESWNIWNTDES